MAVFELFQNMMKEEWRLHSTMFGSLSFALFPVLIFAIVFMGSFLLPLLQAVLPVGDLALIVHGNFVLLGVMVGGFGLLGNEVMNRRFGQASLLAYSSRSLPLSERTIFTNFVVKDIVYYIILWVFPFAFGFAVASPFIRVPLATPLLLMLTLTLSFLTGLSAIFFLSTVYSRSKAVFIIVLMAGLLFLARGLLAVGISAAYYFPPLALYREFTWSMLIIACFLIIIPVIGSILLFTPEYSGSTKRFFNLVTPLTRDLSMFPTPALAAKDLIDLWRSGGGVGQVIFSFLLPLALIWLFLAFLGVIIPSSGIILIFAVLTGVVSATMYTWITAFDSFSSYACLPVSVSTLINSKICTFSVLQLVPAVFITLVTTAADGVLYLIPSLVLWCAISFYALSVTIYLTGLSPNVLVYDAKVLLAFMVLVGVPVTVLIAIVIINPYYAIAAILLGIPAIGFVHRGYKRWEGKDVASF
jgi:hypothetical protein